MSPDVSTPASVHCGVRLHLAGGKALRGTLFLLLDESRPGGVMPVETLLDGQRAFIPVGVEGGRNILIARSSIAAVEILEDQSETFLPYPPGGSLDLVSLTLDTGQELTGLLQSLSPLEAARTSDVFNDAERFIVLQVEDRRILVSKAHIVQISL
jgi:hypothetical protein